MKQRWLLLVLFHFSLVACSKAPESLTPQLTSTSTLEAPTASQRATGQSPTTLPSLTSTPLPTPTPVAVLTGTFEITRALSLLYAQNEIAFNPDGTAQVSTDQGVSTIDVLLAAPFTENHTEKYVLLTDISHYYGDCYSCGVPIQAAIFAKQGNIWHVELQGEGGELIGTRGHASPGKLVKIGPDHYGFLFFDTFSGEGYSWSTLVLYAEVKGFFGLIGSIPKFSENMDGLVHSGQEWSYESIYQFVPGNNAEYYDLHVNTTGTKVIDGELAPVDEKAIYRFNAQDYFLSYTRQYTSTPTPWPEPVSDGSFTIKEALQMLYKSYAGATVTDQHAVYIPEVYSDTSGTGVLTWTVNVILAAPFTEANIHKYVVLTEWSGFERDDLGGCHSCGVGIGGGVFAQANGKWIIESQNISNTLDVIGTWGHAPDGKLVQIGPHKHGFLFFDTFGGQGYFETWLKIYAEVNGVLKQVVSIPKFYEVIPDLGRSWLETGQESVYQFVPGSNAEYYDLRVNTVGVGIDEKDREMIPISLQNEYMFNGSEYVPP